MCISPSPPPPIQFSPINYSTIEGNFLLQPLQTMKRTSLKEVLLFEVVIEAAKAAAATNRGPWSVWISKRAAPQNKKIIFDPHKTLKGPTLSACAIFCLIKSSDKFPSSKKLFKFKGKTQRYDFKHRNLVWCFETSNWRFFYRRWLLFDITYDQSNIFLIKDNDIFEWIFKQ